jgi:tRNA pseudouridine38-40 synthase
VIRKSVDKTVKLLLEYDGTWFSGWQVQPKRRTVQGEIEKAVHGLTGKFMRITGAGRTDAGVHALGQVACLPAHDAIPEKAYKNGLNALLPEDVRILDAEILEGRFHARFDATGRTYRYILSNDRTVLRRHYVWHPGIDFDVECMQEVSALLLGQHDFTSFCKQNPEESTYRCTVSAIDWIVKDCEVWLEITADRFLHHMVRILVGSLLQVGAGKITSRRFQGILEARDRRKAGRTAPPHGLYLLSVNYN